MTHDERNAEQVEALQEYLKDSQAIHVSIGPPGMTGLWLGRVVQRSREEPGAECLEELAP